MTVLNTASAVYLGATRADKVYSGPHQVWPPAPVQSAYDAAVLADGPAHYWPLSDPVGSLAAADVVGGADGTSLVNVTFGVTGMGDGKTAAHIAAGYIHADIGAVDDQHWTCELCVNAEGGGGSFPLITKARMNYPDPWDAYFGVGNPVNALCGDGGNAYGANGNTPILPDRWWHIAYTYDHTSRFLKVYINGVLDGQNGGVGDFVKDNPTSRFLIGMRDDQGTGAATGLAAKAAFYKKVLTPEQILAHAKAGGFA
jgi:Concanavalin A-like lectin/glucanases superfamily